MRTSKSRGRASRRVYLPFVLIAGIVLPVVAAERTTSEIMHDVYDAIAYLLPLSLRDPGQSSAWDRTLIDQKLWVLENASAALKAHMANQEQEVSYLARSFDSVSQDVHKAFQNEWPEFAYFSMMDLMQHCVSCHSRLAAPSQAWFGQRLLARMDTREMPESDVVKLFVATRQFDAALGKLEKMLLDPQLHPIEADYTSSMVDYVQIALAAKQSPALAIDFLQRYLGRSDVPFYLVRRIEFWIASLEALTADLAAAPTLERARRIFVAADGLSRAPGNRLRAVHDLVAQTILRKYLALPERREARDLGEAYYMLGVIALRTLEAKSAVPEMEMLLAASIKADPEGAHAEEAYALIEEYGYVHEETLAAPDANQSLIDMQALRALIRR